MDEKTRWLVDRWIIAFLDPPAVLDPHLMRLILDEHEAGAKHDER